MLRIFEEPLQTPLPVPSVRRSGSRNGSQSRTILTKGHFLTPKTKLISRGVASVQAAAITKQQTKQMMVEAREKLLQLQESLRRSYEEVYRRLVPISTTSYEEISGERSAKKQSHFSADSPMYLRKLFEKFDSNSNGLISKEEFRLALRDMSIDISREECDIFFHRFHNTSSSGTQGKGGSNNISTLMPIGAGNEINWKDFVDFFQQQIIGATNKAVMSHNSNNDNYPISSKAAWDSNIIALLEELKSTLQFVLIHMKTKKINSIDAYLESGHNHNNTAAASNSDNETAKQSNRGSVYKKTDSMALRTSFIHQFQLRRCDESDRFSTSKLYFSDPCIITSEDQCK